MEPGDLIGIDSVQRIMRSATQSNLSSFHEAGLRSFRNNLSVQNVLDVTGDANTSMEITTDDHESFRREYLYRKFGYYVLGYKSSLYLSRSDEFWEMDSDGVLVRFYVDYKKLIEDCRSLRFIKGIITSKKDYDVVISSDFVGILDIVERFTINEPVNQKIFEILDIDMGIDGILDYVDGKSSGSNLDVVSRIRNVDRTLLRSNNIRQVERKLGIEAARNVIFKELGKDSLVIADYMTWHGRVHAFNKFGPWDKGIIASMGFERPNKDIARIGIAPEVDPIESTYSQTVMGNVPSIVSNNPNFRVIDAQEF